MTLRREYEASGTLDPLVVVAPGERVALDEENFRRVIAIERKRTERSAAPFVLMLLESSQYDNAEKSAKALDSIALALLSTSRDTDIVGWYKEKATLGALYTGLVVKEKTAILSTILNRISATLRDELTYDQFNQITISLHFFPDEWDKGDSGRPSNPALYPDLSSREKTRRPLLVMKRALDIAGSLLLLALCAPICLAIAIAIKVTSKGPVLFKQQRVGQFGKSFTFLKFRSMYVNNDHAVHQEFVTKLIARAPVKSNKKESGEAVYKIKDDKRITPIGKFLRRSSLDELPQFLNVLKGEMALVGPRPPIPYELAAYQTWHRRRLLEVKPGLTGLWQVAARSSVDFDDMVRLDLRYATTWTLWLDLKILLRTPLAVVKGSGAY